MKSLQRIEVIFSSGRAGTKIYPIQKGTGISLIFDIRGSIKLRICLFPIEMAVPGLCGKVAVDNIYHYHQEVLSSLCIKHFF